MMLETSWNNLKPFRSLFILVVINPGWENFCLGLFLFGINPGWNNNELVQEYIKNNNEVVQE